MRIAPFSFKEFDASVAVMPKARAGMKPLLPGGRQKEEAPPPPPPPPTFSEEELAAAKQDAYKKGFEAGILEGRAQAQTEQANIDKNLTEHIGLFAASLSPLFHDYHEFILQMRADMPRVAHAIAKKVASDALFENAEKIIENVAVSCCETMLGEPKLQIVVHPRFAPSIQQKLQDLALRIPSATDMIVIGDEHLPQSDCRIEWGHGKVERNTEELWTQVEKAIGDMIESSEFTTRNHIEQLQQSLDFKPDSKE